MSPHPITVARGQMSVARLAEKSGIPAVTIARLEAGLTSRPQRTTLVALAEHLPVDVNSLETSIVTFAQEQRAAQQRAADAEPRNWSGDSELPQTEAA